jgi:hypothetical protein
MMAQEAVAVRGTRPLERAVYAPERSVIIERAPADTERAPERAPSCRTEKSPCREKASMPLSAEDEAVIRMLERVLERSELPATEKSSAEKVPVPSASAPADRANSSAATVEAAERLRAENAALRQLLEELRERTKTQEAGP